MKLSDIYTDVDPFRVLLTGHLPPEDLARICSATRTESVSYGPPRNNLLTEGFMGSIGKAAMLKSRAATMIPADLKKDPAISKLLDVAHKSDQLVTAGGMDKWWAMMAKAMATKYGLPDAKAAEILSAAKVKVVQAGEKLETEHAAGKEGTDAARGDKDEMVALKKKYAKQAAIKKLKEKYGISGDEPESPEDMAAADLKKKAKMKTLAPFLKAAGIETTDDMDYDSTMEIINAAGGLKALLGKAARKAKKKGATLPTEDAEKVVLGVARMLLSEQPQYMVERFGIETLKKFLGNEKKGLKRLWDAGSLPLRYAKKAITAPYHAAGAMSRDLANGGEGHKNVGKSALSGLLGLFSRGGRDSMGDKAMEGAIKSYLIAMAVSEMAKVAQADSTKAGAGLADDEPADDALNGEEILGGDLGLDGGKEPAGDEEPAAPAKTPPAADDAGEEEDPAKKKEKSLPPEAYFG